MSLSPGNDRRIIRTALCVQVLLFCAVVRPHPGQAATRWVAKKRTRLQIRSSKGQAVLSYTVSHPSKWRYKKVRVGCYLFAPNRHDVAFAVKPIHKGDAGPEQLLNRKNGLKKWVARVQPTTRLLKVHKVKVMGRLRQVLELKGTRRAGAMFFFVMLLRIGDVNLVLLAGGPLKEQARFKKVYWQMFRRFKASSP